MAVRRRGVTVRKHAAVGRTEERAAVFELQERRRAEATMKIAHLICKFANGSCLCKERATMCETVGPVAREVLAIGVADERENWR